MSWREQFQQLRDSAPGELLGFLDAALGTAPGDLDLRFEFARQAQLDGQFVRAIGAYIPIARAGGDRQFLARLYLGECFEHLNDMAGARLAYAQAAESDPGNQWPVLHLARLERREAGLEAAMALLDASVGLMRADGKAAIIRRLADYRAEQKYDAERPAAEWRVARDISLPALHDAVMIMLVKDEGDIIGQNLRHHFALGFRRICILDNASTDDTAAVISAFRAATPQARVLTLHDPVTGHYQAAKMAAAERLCEAYMAIEGAAPRWLFFIDADEFITFAGTGDLAASAAALNADLLEEDKTLFIMHWVHCASREILRVFPGDGDPFAYFSQFCPRLKPAVPKVAYRAGQGLRLMEGNHFVSAYEYGAESAVCGATYGLFLFHFTLRSAAHVYRKVVNGGQAYLAAQGLDEHGGHWRRRYELFQQHGERAILQILANHIRETAAGGG
jgi:glycosyltransferase involved in cell wall biosynthesis